MIIHIAALEREAELVAAYEKISLDD
jgi:hypothetical protein